MDPCSWPGRHEGFKVPRFLGLGAEAILVTWVHGFRMKQPFRSGTSPFACHCIIDIELPEKQQKSLEMKRE